MIKFRKKYKELNFLVKKKHSIKPWQHMYIFDSKVTNVGKKTTKNITFYTHTILLLVIYSTDKQKVVIIN